MELPSQPTEEFPYELERTIGQGAMGVVYLARDPSLDRQVAIKVLREDFLARLTEQAAREASQRFLQEARASAALSHPGIVTIHRLGSVNGLSYIAMEWVEGRELETMIRQRAPFPVSEACDLASQVLGALEVAHHNDVVHRDVKPGNVMVQPDGTAKLTDFGIAQVKDSELVKTQAGEVLGTPLYASPEQLLERGVDPRSDLFSVGVILYQMLTGELPLDGDTAASVATKIVNEQPTRVGTLNPQVPEGLETVVHRAMAKQRKSRFASADEMRQFLEQWRDSTDSNPASTSLANGSYAPDQSPGVADGVETLVAEGRRPVDLVVSTVLDWPGESLGECDTEQLLEKLLETPLHADPFAGAARIGNSLFLIHQGLIFASIDLEDGTVGDHVYEQLPEAAPATLHPVPERLDPNCIPHFASTLYPSERLHKDLDTEFTDLPALVDRLRDDNFDGAVHLEDGSELGYLFIHRGDEICHVFSAGWEPDPAEHSWQSLLTNRSVTAHVELRRTVFPSVTYRRELEERSFRVSPTSEGQEAGENSGDSTIGMRYTNWNIEPEEGDGDQAPGRATTFWRDLYRSDPMYGLLEWMLAELPSHMEERKRFDDWKYLTHWIADISRANLYHAVPRPNSRESETFDLVTEDDDRKVLHVARQVSRLTPERLEEFLTDVEAAKKARNDRGDIGAAILMARDRDEAFQEAYQSATSDFTSWMANVTESITGYEGFVRTGMRRGFHLLPILHTSQGFEPILPDE
jgi:serine/threonine protein kinase